MAQVGYFTQSQGLEPIKEPRAVRAFQGEVASGQSKHEFLSLLREDLSLCYTNPINQAACSK